MERIIYITLSLISYSCLVFGGYKFYLLISKLYVLMSKIYIENKNMLGIISINDKLNKFEIKLNKMNDFVNRKGGGGAPNPPPPPPEGD